ncbi:MAG: hypothetical protein K6A38_04105 [Lachnospiraceae bacterium]|nr:hypothetical protein [Lachnospiraceae bacterium]
MSISLKGSLPVEEENKRVIAAAIRESVTNTFRHAKGNSVYIDSMADKTEYTVVIRNDGEAPKGKIVEKGGLLNLRKLVERTGGCMEIKSSPQYELRIKLFGMG